MNSRSVTFKFSNLEQIISKALVVMLAVQALMALFVDLWLYYKERLYYVGLWYLFPAGYQEPAGQLPDQVAYWITVFVLFPNLMPVSLYATMQV